MTLYFLPLYFSQRSIFLSEIAHTSSTAYGDYHKTLHYVVVTTLQEMTTHIVSYIINTLHMLNKNSTSDTVLLQSVYVIK